jgi:hypothetical protein
MAFKGIEDRFKARAAEVYGKYSTKDGSSHHPYLEWKPNDKNAQEQRNDSRMLPVGAVKRDIARIGKWSVSGEGALFLLKQEAQQLGNTFSESRVINPLFVVANLVPYIHAKRPLADASSFAVTGDAAKKSPGSTPNVGAAGRLQKETAKAVTANLMGQGGKNSILSLIPTGNVLNAVKGVFSLKDKGSLGVDQRPELDFNGEYFSIALWKGFKKQHGFSDNLESAAANLRVGNIKGAVSSVKAAANNVVNQLKGNLPKNLIISDGRASPTSNQDGRRYFITSKTEAERYLNNSVVFTTAPDGSEFTAARLSFLNRQPYVLAEQKIETPKPSVPKATTTAVNSLRQTTLPKLGGLGSSLSNASKIIDAGKKLGLVKPTTNVESANPAEDSLLFTDRSLKSRYDTDERLSFIKDQLETQNKAQTKYWEANKSKLGFDGAGYTAGQNISPDPTQRYFLTHGNFRDKINLAGAVHDIRGTEPTSADVESLKKSLGGADAINVWFFDYAKKQIIPFRAFLSGVSEKVNPEFNDTRYVGRIERNIVYTGVTRDVSFQLRVYAMSVDELKVIWSKVERLTGLCYPGKFSNGFMVPPFVKLTLGNLYFNQPCYIKSLTHQVEDGTTWQTDDGVQVPHGVTMNVTVSIIEKNQKKSGSRFYDLTERK